MDGVMWDHTCLTSSEQRQLFFPYHSVIGLSYSEAWKNTVQKGVNRICAQHDMSHHSYMYVCECSVTLRKFAGVISVSVVVILTDLPVMLVKQFLEFLMVH